jgi:hypothetical protein
VKLNNLISQFDWYKLLSNCTQNINMMCVRFREKCKVSIPEIMSILVGSLTKFVKLYNCIISLRTWFFSCNKSTFRSPVTTTCWVATKLYLKIPDVIHKSYQRLVWIYKKGDFVKLNNLISQFDWYKLLSNCTQNFELYICICY